MRLEPPPAHQRRRERLRRVQIGRELGVARPPREEAQHAIDMTHVELLERGRVVRGEQVFVAAGQLHHLSPTS